MQYTKAFVDALQFMWGAGFLSPGGPAEVAQILEGVEISGARVLDVGSGLGGVDILLATKFGAGEVIGIDVEEQLIEESRALIEKKHLSDRISFQLVAPGPLPFAEASFDIVFSKDAMVHIPDKPGLYREVMRVLRPGGTFVASDWLWAEGAAQAPEVVAWFANLPLKFTLTTPAEAAACLKDAGFAEWAIVDRREFLQEINRRELRALEGPLRDQLARIVGDEMANARRQAWRYRQAALDNGWLLPSHLKGRMPG